MEHLLPQTRDEFSSSQPGRKYLSWVYKLSPNNPIKHQANEINNSIYPFYTGPDPQKVLYSIDSNLNLSLHCWLSET